MDNRITVRFSCYSAEQKKAIVEYAATRGFLHVSDFVRHAVAEYIRRRPPKKEVPALQMFYAE